MIPQNLRRPRLILFSRFVWHLLVLITLSNMPLVLSVAPERWFLPWSKRSKQNMFICHCTILLRNRRQLSPDCYCYHTRCQLVNSFCQGKRCIGFSVSNFERLPRPNPRRSPAAAAPPRIDRLLGFVNPPERSFLNVLGCFYFELVIIRVKIGERNSSKTPPSANYSRNRLSLHRNHLGSSRWL